MNLHPYMLGDPESGLANLRIGADGEMQCTPIGAAIMAVVEARRNGVTGSTLARMLDIAEAGGFTGRADVIDALADDAPLNAEVPRALVDLACALWCAGGPA